MANGGIGGPLHRPQKTRRPPTFEFRALVLGKASAQIVGGLAVGVRCSDAAAVTGVGFLGRVCPGGALGGDWALRHHTAWRWA